MVQLFRKKAKPNGRVGLVVNDDLLAIAHVEERGGKPFLLQCSRVELQSEREAGNALSKLVNHLGLAGTQCSYVLNRKDYSLLLLEAPSVEADEMRSAVRWKIKDLLDMKVEDAAIDVFPVPDDAYRGRRMVYVVASRNTHIQSIVNMVNDSGLELTVIDIPELIMKNISSRFIDDEFGVAFMDLRRNGSTMNISHNGDLYLSRQINTQVASDVMQSPEWGHLRDRLVLEIQRSLDYYVSQVGKTPISRVVIAQRQHDGAEMVAALNEFLDAEVSVLDLAQNFDSDLELTPELQQICMAAIGATLRGGKKPVKRETSNQEAA